MHYSHSRLNSVNNVLVSQITSAPSVICCFMFYNCGSFISFYRPGRKGGNQTGRGVLSMQGLSYGVVRVDDENSLMSLTLQDCGQVLPGGML